jgi:hypothetical protein
MTTSKVGGDTLPLRRRPDTTRATLKKSTQRTTTMGDLLVVIIDTWVDWGLLS